ncbi:MAG: AAA family ATPase [Cycloclasticus sp.]
MSISCSISEFQKEISNLFKARFPFLYISTWEESRVIDEIKEVAEDEGLIKTTRDVVEWSIIESESCQQDTGNALLHLNSIENCEKPTIFILKDFHVFFGGSGKPLNIKIIRKIRELAQSLSRHEFKINVVIISPVTVLPVDIEKDITLIDFPLPTTEDIKYRINEFCTANNESALTEKDKEKLAKAALGLTLIEAENALAKSKVITGGINLDALEIILNEKKQIIQKSGILEFIDTQENLDNVGGLGNLKSWLLKRTKSWLTLESNYKLPSPKGVLLTGIPGCGKSLIAKSIASNWSLPLLKLDVGSIFSGVVGSSEENMRRAIKAAEAISPVVLWVDEIEKGFNHSTSASGDSGTSSRVFASFLTWMQEKQKQVFVVATSNNISGLPPEMLRKGRFDEIFFVDLPTDIERKDIIRMHFNKRVPSDEHIGKGNLNEDFLHSLTQNTEGFSGAEIEQVIINSLFEAFSEDRKVCGEDLILAAGNTVPLSTVQAEYIQGLRHWANTRAISASPKPAIEAQPLAIQKEPKARGGRAVDC